MALRLVYNDYESTFDGTLIKDRSFTAHHHSIQTLATELYKVYDDTSQTITLKLVAINGSNNGYHLHSKSDFVIL